MRTIRKSSDVEGFERLDAEETRVLTAREERELLRSLADCKRKLADALSSIQGADVPEGTDDAQALAECIATICAGDGPSEARLGAVFHRYSQLRTRLALANMRLVAHIAKRFRERGVHYADLLQEGFCGLLEAIDRFDLTHETKLATYATWWIRQAMQRAVASGAYPVRLSPRHLRLLAQNQGEVDRSNPVVPQREATAASEIIHRIHAATRPTVSLDASHDSESGFSLMQTISDPQGDRTDNIDTDETVARLFQSLRPREQEVLAFRFGLGDKPQLSLSQVGKVLDVSKERVRQIQDRALEKLRAAADEQHVDELLFLGS